MWKQLTCLMKLPKHKAERKMARAPMLAEIDRWAARQAINCFDRKASHVRLLLDVEDESADAWHAVSVRLLHGPYTQSVCSCRALFFHVACHVNTVANSIRYE